MSQSVNTQTSKTKLLCFTAVCAALVCVGTFIAVPLPIGYFNLGDIFVLTAAWILGPWWGAAAAGIGAGLADLLMGYASYAPATLIIKALMAIVAYAVSAKLTSDKTTVGKAAAVRVLAAVLGEAVMVGGYFLFESLIMGYGMGAAASIPGNALQGLCGVIGSVALSTALAANRTSGKFLGIR